MHLGTLSLPDTANETLTNPAENKKIMPIRCQVDGYVIILIWSHSKSTATCYVKSSYNQPVETSFPGESSDKAPELDPRTEEWEEVRLP